MEEKKDSLEQNNIPGRKLQRGHLHLLNKTKHSNENSECLIPLNNMGVRGVVYE